jgi:PAS domain S-box-containing protein
LYHYQDTINVTKAMAAKRTPKRGSPLPRAKLSRTKSVKSKPARQAARAKAPKEQVFRHPKTELEAAVQRYVDLFDFAPIAYVSFNRVGRIEESNLVAAQLLGRSRDRLIGQPFALHVAKKDGALFLNHLLRCRSSESRIETELHLKKQNGEIILARLASSPMTSSMRYGALLYQTAIIDLTERKRAEETRVEALRQRAALYELSQRHQEAKTLDEIYEAALDAILTALSSDRASILLYDQQQVMRFVAWRGLSGKYRKVVEGHSPWKPDAKNPQPVCIADVDLADISKPLKSTIRTEGIRAVAFIPLVSSRTLIGKFMTYYNAPHVFIDDELKLATTIARQLAQTIQHKRDEEALRESEERLRAIVQQANAGMARYDLKGRIEFVNSRFCKILGYNESELIGKSVREITYAEDVEKTMRALQRVLKKGEPTEIEKRYICKDGSLVWVNVSDAPERDAAGRPKSVVAVVVNITARKKAEAALQKSKELLEERVHERTHDLLVANRELKSEIERRKGLEGEILSISDREQQRLGQELHDGLCQHLTAVAFMARSVALRLKNHRVIEVRDIVKIAELVNEAATNTRDLSRALHRIDVDAVGLVTALEDLVDREIWKIPCRLEVKPSFHIDDDAVAAQLYRIAREAVINANKHSGARQIVVRLERSPRGMALRVVDDGVGFSNEPKLKRGLGCHIMKYRAQLIGGRLEIDSSEQGGTCVSCYLPNSSGQSRKKESAGSRRFPSKIAKALVALV